MATTLLGEARPGQGKIRSSGGIPVIEETFHYLVQTDNKNETRLNVLTTAGLPIVNESVSTNGLTVCRTKDATRRPDQVLYWDVTCTFSSEVAENGGTLSSDPQTWVPVYETKFERLQETVTKDRTGKAIANSAGHPFQTGLTIGRFIPVWEFFQFEPSSVSDETIIDRNETVNQNPFRGRAANTLLLTVMSSIVGFYYGQPRRLTQYSLKYNRRTWKHKRLDVGRAYKQGADNFPYLDKQNNIMLGGLNGAGGKVAAGDPPAVLEFDVYEAIPFSFLRG